MNSKICSTNISRCCNLFTSGGQINGNNFDFRSFVKCLHKYQVDWSWTSGTWNAYLSSYFSLKNLSKRKFRGTNKKYKIKILLITLYNVVQKNHLIYHIFINSVYCNCLEYRNNCLSYRAISILLTNSFFFPSRLFSLFSKKRAFFHLNSAKNLRK